MSDVYMVLGVIVFVVLVVVLAVRESRRRAKRVEEIKRQWLESVEAENLHRESAASFQRREGADRLALVTGSVYDGQRVIRCSQGHLVGIGRPARYSSVNDRPVYDPYSYRSRPTDASGLYSSPSDNSTCSDSSSDSGSSCD